MHRFLQFTRSTLWGEFAWVEAIIFGGNLMVSEAIFLGGNYLGGEGAIIQVAIVLEPNKIVKDTHREKKASNVSPVTWIHEYGHLGIWYIKSTIKEVLTPFFVRGPFCTPHFISLNIGFWRCSFVLKHYVFNLSTFN